jgi:hypothetical protein
MIRIIYLLHHSDIHTPLIIYAILQKTCILKHFSIVSVLTHDTSTRKYIEVHKYTGISVGLQVVYLLEINLCVQFMRNRG